MANEIAPPGCRSDARFLRIARQIEKAQPGAESIVMSGNMPGSPSTPMITVVGPVDAAAVQAIAGNAGVVALVDTDPAHQGWAPGASCWVAGEDGFDPPKKDDGEMWVVNETLPIIKDRNVLYGTDHGGQFPLPWFQEKDSGLLPGDLQDFFAFGQSSLTADQAHTLFCGVTGVALNLPYQKSGHGFSVGDRVTFVDPNGKPNRGVIGAVDRNKGKVEVLTSEPNQNVPGSGQFMVGGFTMDPAGLVVVHKAQP
jgi:hypothetical protein